MWCGSLPAFPRKSEGYRMPRASKGAHGKRRSTHWHGRKRPHAEASEDRTLEVGARASLTLLQKSTDSVRRREADAIHFTRFGIVQGRAPSLWPHVREYVAAGEETLARNSKRKPHVTVFEVGGPRAWRGELAMEGILDRRGRRIFTERLQSTVLADSAELTHRVSGAGATGGDRDVRGSVVSGARGRNTSRVNPKLPAEADPAL